MAEDNAFVSAAHPAYASLMERTLGKVVLVHVSGMEKLCQVGFDLAHIEAMPSEAMSCKPLRAERFLLPTSCILEGPFL